MGLCCAPQGHGAAGAVPAGRHGAAAGQPPHRSPPHQPDTGQCREEIQALSSGWLQPLPQPRPLACNFLAWPSQQRYPGLCLLHQGGGRAGRRHGFPLTRRGEGTGWIRPPRSPSHQWRRRNMDFDGEGAGPEPPLGAPLCPPTRTGCMDWDEHRGLGGNKPPETRPDPQQPPRQPPLSSWQPDGVSPERGRNFKEKM